MTRYPTRDIAAPLICAALILFMVYVWPLLWGAS
jgi:hypothetical protein